jgi:hypothetical protein
VKGKYEIFGGQNGRGDGWTVPSTIDLWKLACAVIQGTVCTWMSTNNHITPNFPLPTSGISS